MFEFRYAKLFAIAGAVLLSAVTAHGDEGRETWRLFVADHTDPKITAFDLDAPQTRWTFNTEGPARLYATPHARAIVAVQSDHDAVGFLASGLSLDSHGDHKDIKVAVPQAIAGVLRGPRPFHLVAHQNQTAINFDRGGFAVFLKEADILAGRISGERFPQNRAHHGFAAPLGRYVVSSVASMAPTEKDALPPRVGIRTYEPSGAPVGEMHVCTDLHGEAFSGAYLVAGCKEGVIAARQGNAAPEYAMLRYPESLPEGSTGTLLGSPAMQIFLGNYGAKSVVVIDPTTKPYFTRVELPFRRVDFLLDPVKHKYAYIFTEDGTLHRLDMLSAKIDKVAKLTQPYSMDGHWSDPRPRLAIAGNTLVVTDPLAGLIRLIDTATLAESGTIKVAGLPYNVIAVGGSGLTH